MQTTPFQEPISWSVSALVHAIADTLKVRFSAIVVRGEISGLSRATSGHCYFTLKDEASQIRCAMFQRAANMLSFQPANGDEVELRGRLAIYEQRGELQLVVESMRSVGQGRLLEQFERFKAKLGNEGLFDAKRKQAPPPYPQTIGVISSLQAAALHDVLTALKRRTPHVHIIIYPTAVQGTQAVGEIVSAINTANARQEVDTLLVCRGGGSLEDLWCFNEEAVVRAVAACAIPIISGVGHETDFTLTDFAVDVRAPTPTAAAELAAQPQQALNTHIEQQAQQLKKQLHRLLEQYAQRIDRSTLALRQPAFILHTQKQKLEHAALRLHVSAKQVIQQKSQSVAEFSKRWPELNKQAFQTKGMALRELLMRWHQHAPVVLMRDQYQHTSELASRFQWTLQKQLGYKKQHLHELNTRLTALDPSKVLSRGYAWVSDDKGHAVSSVKQLRPGQAIQAQFSDGKAQATVTQSEPDLLPLLDQQCEDTQ